MSDNVNTVYILPRKLCNLHISFQVFHGRQRQLDIIAALVSDCPVCIECSIDGREAFKRRRKADKLITVQNAMLSCILNTVIGVALVSLTAVLAAAAALGAYFSMFAEESAAELMEQLRNANIDMGLTDGTMLLEIPEFLISFVAEIILLMAAMIVGSQLSKHPVFYGVLIYIGINELVSFGCELLGSYIQAPMLLTAVCCLIYGTLAAGAYFAAYTIMEKHLNLT